MSNKQSFATKCIANAFCEPRGKTYCWDDIMLGDPFVSIDHAYYCVQRDRSYGVCDECLNEIATRFNLAVLEPPK